MALGGRGGRDEIGIDDEVIGRCNSDKRQCSNREKVADTQNAAQHFQKTIYNTYHVADLKRDCGTSKGLWAWGHHACKCKQDPAQSTQHNNVGTLV